MILVTFINCGGGSDTPDYKPQPEPVPDYSTRQQLFDDGVYHKIVIQLIPLEDIVVTNGSSYELTRLQVRGSNNNTEQIYIDYIFGPWSKRKIFYLSLVNTIDNDTVELELCEEPDWNCSGSMILIMDRYSNEIYMHLDYQFSENIWHTQLLTTIDISTIIVPTQ
jgi:hypothetical protein